MTTQTNNDERNERGPTPEKSGMQMSNLQPSDMVLDRK